MSNLLNVAYDKLDEQTIDAVHIINDWGYPIIIIGGRILIIHSDIEMADQFQSNDEHYIVGKDITKYINNEGVSLVSQQNKAAFNTYLIEVKHRYYKFHKDERYLRYTRHGN